MSGTPPSLRRASAASSTTTETVTTSSSPPVRKYGLHLLNHPQISMKQTDPGYMAAAEGKGEPAAPSVADRPMRKSSVETFLDDNGDFLEDYIQRKVHRSQLEQWLFRTNRNRAGSEQFSSSTHFREQQVYVNRHHLSVQDQQRLNATYRQRSRSFTPLRKLSATKFEESGLATPILNRDIDGQVSFLRTQRDIEQKEFNATRIGSAAAKTAPNSPDCIRPECLFSLVEDIVRETDSAGIARRLSHGLKKAIATPVDSVKVLLARTSGSLSGDLYSLDHYENFSKDSCGSANAQMTAAMTSKQVHLTERPDAQDDDDGSSNRRVCSVLTAPLVNLESGSSIGAVQLLSSGAVFTGEDKRMMQTASRLSSMVFLRAGEKRTMSLELARSEVFLELARTVFGEQSRIEPTIKTILANFLTMIECERCQILLKGDSGGQNNQVFKKVFDLQRCDLDENGSADSIKFDAANKFPCFVGVTGEVAHSGKKTNIPDMLKDPRFADEDTEHRSMLCMPIRDSTNDKILGVISLINKENGGIFTENDERFTEAFSLFCGMAIKNASDFETAIVSEAKLQVAFETLNVQATASEEEARCLSKVSVPSASVLNLDSFKFNYIDLEDMDMYKGVIRMFTDFGLLSRFDINYDVFCRWLLTVKKNYRNETVKYHNWYHAFNVCQTMYCMLKNTRWHEQMGEVECLGLLVACLGHDLDHRGTTNSFQIKAKNSLAKLYSSSTMERHHLNQCLLLLNIPGNRILENMTENEYTSVISVIERSILATDLAHHFKMASGIRALANSASARSNALDLTVDSEQRQLIQCALMTGADLGAVTKPWAAHHHVTMLVAEEFWAQGDLEREEFHEAPAPMMDRQFSLALVQIDFIDKIAKDVYGELAQLHPVLRPMQRGCLENRARWESMERGEEVDAEDEEERNARRPRSTERAARNL